MMKKLSVVIPMYNEIVNAPKTAAILSGYVEERLGHDFEILFSDDGSTDGCAEAVNALNAHGVRVERYETNRGKGYAVREGVRKSNGDVIVFTDSDLAYGEEAVYGIYKLLVESGANAVIGSRNIRSDGYEGYTAMRKLMSKVYIKLISVFAGFKYTDSQCGLKAFTAESARTLFPCCVINGYAFDFELLILADKLKMVIKEFPVKIINHSQNGSKVNPVKDAFKMLYDVKRIKKAHKNFGKE